MAVYRVPMTKVLGMFIRGDDALSLLNWSDTLKGTPDFPLNNWGRDTPRAQLPGGDNTRAESVGRLVTQVLTSAGCEVPGLVAAPGDVPRGRLTKATNTRQINSDFQSGG